MDGYEDFVTVRARQLRELEAKHGVLGLAKMLGYLDSCLVFYRDHPEISIWGHFWWLVQTRFRISSFDAREIFLWWVHK